jgi:hypothetical protein
MTSVVDGNDGSGGDASAVMIGGESAGKGGWGEEEGEKGGGG